MGSYEERLIRDGETQILLVTGNEMAPVVAKHEDNLKALLNRYRDLFGRSARSRFLMVINHASYDGAGAFPSSISIETTETASSVSDGDAPKLLYLLAHETLHLWNGRLLKSAGQIEWLKEGFTDYYSWMSMYRAGQITEEVLFEKLGERIDRYQKAAGSVSISAAGREKSKNYGIVYYGGLTAALLLDLDIRRDTKGEKSLDDVMRGLAAKFVGQKRGYRIRDILAEVELVSGESYEEFFEVHLKSMDALPVQDMLKVFGIELELYSGADAQSQRIRFSEKLSKRQRVIVNGWRSVNEK